MRRLGLALLILLGLCGAAVAQGCGSSNPNCVVPTAPIGTSNNQAASTAFVVTQIANATVIGIIGAPGTINAGPSTPVAGVSAATDWIWGTTAAQTNLTNSASIWPAPLVVRNGFGFGKICNNTDSSGSPCNALFFYAGANNITQNVTAITTYCIVLVANGACWGGNSIALDNNVNGAKVVGWEFDIAPSAGHTPSSNSGGLFINEFNVPLNGPAIFVNSTVGGGYTNGLIFGGAYTGALFGGLSGATASIGLDLSAATFASSEAIVLGNGSSYQLNFKSSNGLNPASLYNDASNNFTVLAGLNNLIVFGKNNATVFPFQFDTNGDVLSIGVSGTTAGSIAFKNATSGTITLAPATGALGTRTLTLPATTDTVAVLGTFAAPPAIGNTTPAAGNFTTLSATGVITASAGNTAAPSINFGDAGTGFYKDGTNIVGFTTNGTTTWVLFSDGGLYPGADNSYKLGNATNRVGSISSVIYTFAAASMVDTGLSRDAAGVVDVGNGAAADFSGTIKAAHATFTGLTTGTNADFLCLSSSGVVQLQASACTISSLRFKPDWQPYRGDALKIVSGLEIGTFHLALGPNVDRNAGNLQAGLNAENVAKLAPECAIYEDDGITPKSYRQECVLALVVRALQQRDRQ